MGRDHAVTTARNEDGSSITVHHHGAHLTSWRNKNGEELLYTSPKAVYKDGVAIRGGVPIIFPQFGNNGSLPSHGFARLRKWTEKAVGRGEASFALEVPLSDLEAANSGAPSAGTGTLQLVYTVHFSNNELKMQIEVTNNDQTSGADFAFAFHPYFAVGDVEKTILNGVNLTKFADNTDKSMKPKPSEAMWKFTKEVNRLYINQTCAVMLMDMEKQRTVHISGENLPDVVVWNPWIESSRPLKDLPADGYKQFVCVEHGAITKKVKLPPGGVWKATQWARQLQASDVPSSKL